MRWLHGITDSMDMNLGEFREMVGDGKPGVLQFMGHKGLYTMEQLNNNLLLNIFYLLFRV